MTIRAFDRQADTKTLSGLWLEASRIPDPFIGSEQLLAERQLIDQRLTLTCSTAKKTCCCGVTRGRGDNHIRTISYVGEWRTQEDSNL